MPAADWAMADRTEWNATDSQERLPVAALWRVVKGIKVNIADLSDAKPAKCVRQVGQRNQAAFDAQLMPRPFTGVERRARNRSGRTEQEIPPA